MTSRTKQLDLKLAQAQAAELAQRKLTCEGCLHLQVWPRGQCKDERSPHFRAARETYHERCPYFGVRTRIEAESLPGVPTEAVAEPPKAKPKLEVTAHLRVRASGSEHVAMLARNAARKVSA
jgi:hypothetical protein